MNDVILGLIMGSPFLLGTIVMSVGILIGRKRELI